VGGLAVEHKRRGQQQDGWLEERSSHGSGPLVN
jgi:hypothetical protein